MNERLNRTSYPIASKLILASAASATVSASHQEAFTTTPLAAAKVEIVRLQPAERRNEIRTEKPAKHSLSLVGHGKLTLH